MIMKLSAFLLLVLASTSTCVVVVAQEQAPIVNVLPTGSVVSVRRSVDPDLILTKFNKTCVYDGGSIVFGGPSSLEPGDAYYFHSYRQRLGYQLVLDHVNVHRCGANIGGKHYKLDLQLYDDQSNMALTADIAKKLVAAPFSSEEEEDNNKDKKDAVDIIVAGYSSSLTYPLAAIVAAYNEQQQALLLQNNNNKARPKLMMSAGSALTANFADRPHIFTAVPPVSMFIKPAIEALGTLTNARTVATMWEDPLFTRATCAAAPALIQEFGMDLIWQTNVSAFPTLRELEPVAQNMKELNPDVVLSCVYDCINWHKAMRNVNWSPKAQVFTICLTQEKYQDALGTDVEYMMGVGDFDESLVATDALTGWTAKDFANLYKATSSDAVVHGAASAGAGAMSTLIQAMEATNTTNDADILADYLANHAFSTVSGEATFDENGQNEQPLLLVQYDNTGVLQTTFPVESSSGSIVYPMPTWEGRDCVYVSNCVKIDNHTCTFDGYCECPSKYTSLGHGSTARCVSNDIYYGSSGSTWSSPTTILGMVAACFVAMAMVAWGLNEQRKRRNDAVWKVQKSELVFHDPPVVVGSGTFGQVLLAEYRGTDVAVKRVIPPKKDSKGGGGKDHSGTSSRVSGGNSNAGMSSGMKSGAMSRSGSGTMMRSGSVSMGSRIMSSRMMIGRSEKAERRKLERDFVSEMRYLSKLRHPCVTTVMGAVTGSDPMLIMEYMEHGSLYDLLHNETMVIDAELLVPILQDISKGLRFLHSADPQVLHGDLKAANILVDSKFRAKVADFGLSQKQNLGGTGTPFWMAPELLRMECSNSPATDVYSFGIILYEVYSRRDPYEDEDAEEVLKLVCDKKIRKRPPAPRNMPDKVVSVMADCVEDDPDIRPSFEELNVRLKRINVEEAGSSQQTNKKASSVSLFDIFPRHIAEALRDGRTVEAEHKDSVTIFFSDIVGFTTISSEMEPRKIASMLDRLYTKFDHLSQKHDIFKVETIGDAYMAVTNLVKDQHDDHAKRIAEFAMDAIAAANHTLIDLENPEKGCVNIRVGFHSGSVVADVVGTRNPRYCLFGDSVNTASRMESNSEVNRIHCSKQAAALLHKQCPSIPTNSRGKINIKGKGAMETFWVNEEGVRASLISTEALMEEMEVSEAERSSEFLLPSEHVARNAANPEHAAMETVEEHFESSEFEELAGQINDIEAPLSPGMSPETAPESALPQPTDSPSTEFIKSKLEKRLASYKSGNSSTKFDELSV